MTQGVQGRSVELFYWFSAIKDNSLFKADNILATQPGRTVVLCEIRFREHVLDEMSIGVMAVNYCGLHIL